MALPSLATLDQLEAWPGVTVEDQAAAEAVLSAASAWVRAYTGKTAETDWADTVPAEVSTIVVQMTARILASPDAHVKTWVKGEFSETYFDTASLGLYLTDHEKAMLDGYRRRRRGLSTLSTTRGDYEDSTLYVPTAPAPSGYPLPFLHPEDP